MDEKSTDATFRAKICIGSCEVLSTWAATCPKCNQQFRLVWPFWVLQIPLHRVVDLRCPFCRYSFSLVAGTLASCDGVERMTAGLESGFQMTTSIALFDCPHCIDEFAFDYQKIAKLNYGWRVRVRCPGCGNIVDVIMLNYTLIHGCDLNKYKAGEIVEILRPDPNLSNDWWMSANTLRREILQKQSGWRPQPRR